MKSDITIKLDNKFYSSHEVARLHTIEELSGYELLSSYSQRTLTFCHAWLSGQDIFEIQTSGSTGAPDTIQITRTQMRASAHATAEALGLKAGDKALVCLNTAYIAGKMMLVRGFEIGMPLTVTPPSSIPLVTIKEGIDFTALVPLQLKGMLENDSPAFTKLLNAMKAILVGGAPVDPSLEKLIHEKISTPVFSTYGMTETVSHIALRRLNGPDASDVYRVLPGVGIGRDTRNCLSIKSAVSNHQWLQTNDVVELIDDSHFRWMGRADNVVNSGGAKVYTETLENKLHTVMQEIGIEDRFFLGGIPDERLGEKLCLIIEREKRMDDIQEKALKKWMEAHLHPYEIPKNIIYLPQFILTPTDKMQRKHTLALILGEK